MLFGKFSTKTLGAILVMDNDGKRLIARYYTDDFPTVREQKVCSTQGTPDPESSSYASAANLEEIVTLSIHFLRRQINVFDHIFHKKI